MIKYYINDIYDHNNRHRKESVTEEMQELEVDTEDKDNDKE